VRERHRFSNDSRFSVSRNTAYNVLRDEHHWCHGAVHYQQLLRLVASITNVPVVIPDIIMQRRQPENIPHLRAAREDVNTHDTV
jgi:hypothetical protein